MPHESPRSTFPTKLATKNETLLLLGLVLFLAALTLYRAVALSVANLPLFLDEAYYYDWSRALAFGYYSKPPLIAWTIAASTSLCGESELCVRTPALLLQPFTAFGLFLIGWRLYGARTGRLAAALYATLPLVFASSWIMSTDALLLLFWAYGLWFLVCALDSQRWQDWLGLGFCVGVGLLAKYTMVAFLLSLVLYLALSPAHRIFLRRPGPYLALLVAALLILPNILWNGFHDLVSFRHTANTAALDHSLFHPGKFFEFIAGQALVFGPILIAALPAALLQRNAAMGIDQDAMPDWRRRLLLTMSLPLFLTMAGEALAVRANANWAAPSYLGFTLLVAAWFTLPIYSASARDHVYANNPSQWRRRILTTALVVNILIGCAGYHYDKLYWTIMGATPVRHLDPYARLRGWRELAIKVQGLLAEHPGVGLLGDDRAVLAELDYYIRPRPPTIAVWNPTGAISDQYRLSADILHHPTGEYLFVARGTAFGAATKAFAHAQDLGSIRIPTHPDSTLECHTYLVQHFLGY